MLPLSTEQRQQLITKLQTDSKHADSKTGNQSAEEQRCSEAAQSDENLEEPR
jgi:phosphosulfolactate synthase (CoM biosynthesis protein A)